MARRVPLLSSAPLGELAKGMTGLTKGQQRLQNVIDNYSGIINKARKKRVKSKPKNKDLDLHTMLRKGILEKQRKSKKGCKGVFLKGNPSVLAVLKKIPSLNVKVRDLLPSREDGTCVSKAMTIQYLLRRVPGLKRKLYTLLKSA